MRTNQLLEFLTAALILLLIFGAGTVWSIDVDEMPGDPKKGRDLFISKGCMKCHSIWGGSSEKKAPDLARVGMGRNVYDLCASMWTHWSQMSAVLTKGKVPRIPLTANDIRDIIAYLSYLNYYAAPGNMEEGKKVFSEKKCLQCHPVDPLDQEGKPGRSVFQMQEFQDPATLAVAVWNHGTGMVKSMSERHVDWPEFTGQEVGHLVDFIRSQTVRSGARKMALAGNPQVGQKLFSSKSCSICHRPEGSKQAEVDLTSTQKPLSLNTIVASFWNHYPKMSNRFSSAGITHPKINNKEMEDLLAYVYWMKTYSLRGNAGTGQQLYLSKKCSTCHSPPTSEEINAPELRGSETAQSPYALLAAIWNHGPRMETFMKTKKISWPTLTGEEMRDLVTFLRSNHDDDPSTVP